MSENEKPALQMHFARSDNGVYFSEVRPTQYTPGLLVEVCKEKSEWTGAYFTFHEVHSCECRSKSDCPYQSKVTGEQTPCAMAPKKDMVTAKVVVRADEFKSLINGLKNVFDAVPETVQTLSLEEKAAILAFAETLWRFPSTIIEEIHGRSA